MAIAPTGAIYKSLVFDGEDSRNYGVYITGEAVYNAPARDVEMVEIPGRSGAFALDKGRFENIEVTYPAGIFADNETDFAEAISDFRNFLCSRRGYVRLTDEYNPNEYRMAIYKNGLEVTPAQLKAGEFSIVFDCKPQRWLTSGEDAVTIGEWGDTETASGSIATFEGDEATGIKSLVADIEPIQDLNGYDKPWAGGAGKNKLPYPYYDNSQTKYDITFTVNSDGTVNANGTATAETTFYFLNNQSLASIGLTSGTYVLNGCPSGGSSSTYRIQIRQNGTWREETGSGLTFTYDASSPVNDLIRIDILSGATVNDIVFKPMIRLSSVSDATYEPYENICSISGYDSVVTSVSPTTSASDATTYTTNLSGTRYGGTLDVVSGVLTVTKAIVDLGTLTWTRTTTSAGTYRFYASDLLSVIKKPATMTETSDLMCSQYVATYGNAPNASIQGICIHTNGNLMIYDDAFKASDASTFKTAMSGVQCVYPLATPTTVQLTAQQVSALVGTNNVWANSGDVSVEYGTAPNMLDNPTLFDASPLLAVEGYGTIGFNGYEIELENKTVGDVEMLSNYTSPSGGSANNTAVFTTTLENTALLNAGDAITIGTVSASFTSVRSGGSTVAFTGATVNSTQNFDSCIASIKGGRDFEILTTMRNVAFVYGTASSSATGSASVTLTYNNTSTTKTLTLKLDYDGDKTITITATGQGVTSSWYIGKTIKIPSAYGISSQSALGHPTYIDCDLGEAYLIDSGIPVSLNPYIDLGSDLPKLASGANEITYDNTITELKITPRWWKV